MGLREISVKPFKMFLSVLDNMFKIKTGFFTKSFQYKTVWAKPKTFIEMPEGHSGENGLCKTGAFKEEKGRAA